MRKKLELHLSPALVISAVALFAAIGGGAAIALPGKNSVDSGDIKPNTITGADVKERSFYMGVEVNNSGAVVDSTEPGITASKVANTIRVAFPRNVVNCIPVVSGIFNFEFTALQAGTAPNNVNKVIVNALGVTSDFNLVVVC